MTDNETAKLLDEIAELRAINRGVYTTLDALFAGRDKTLELIRLMYATDPERAKEWHRHILANDIKILELTKKLCA